MRNALLVTEVALSFVLLTGAMLLLRSFDKLTHVDPGFDTAHVLAFQVALSPRPTRRMRNGSRFTTSWRRACVRSQA
jgi:putative ABC transport system permease protein